MGTIWIFFVFFTFTLPKFFDDNLKPKRWIFLFSIFPKSYVLSAFSSSNPYFSPFTPQITKSPLLNFCFVSTFPFKTVTTVVGFFSIVYVKGFNLL